ncbi:MAG: hypothetical protein ABIK21_05265 [bacterium]|nr:hypothetical protein [Actinomycetes bacterium]
MSNLKEKYLNMTDDELIKIVYVDTSDYTAEGIQTAKNILEDRGITQPSPEVLENAKNASKQQKESLDGYLDIFQSKKISKAIKKKDYFYIGTYIFWLIIGYGIFSGLSIGTGMGKWIELIPFAETIKSEWLFILEVVFNIAILGIFPVIFFIIYSLRLSPEQRKERRLFLLMPKYIFFIYGISLFLFLVLVIIP